MNESEQEHGPEPQEPQEEVLEAQEAQAPQGMAAATIKKTRAFSIVWVIPIVALLVAVFLLVSYIRNNGTEITLYMPNADGFEVIKTPI